MGQLLLRKIEILIWEVSFVKEFALFFRPHATCLSIAIWTNMIYVYYLHLLMAVSSQKINCNLITFLSKTKFLKNFYTICFDLILPSTCENTLFLPPTSRWDLYVLVWESCVQCLKPKHAFSKIRFKVQYKKFKGRLKLLKFWAKSKFQQFWK